MIRSIAPILATRSLRSAADSLIALTIPLYLTSMGYSALFVGAISSVMLLGTTLSIFVIGIFVHRLEIRTSLCIAASMMLVTGIGYSLTSSIAVLLLISLLGAVNPSGGDVNLFRPLEYSALSWRVPQTQQTTAFALYSVFGSLSAAVGAAAFSSLDAIIAIYSAETVYQGIFILYAAIGVTVLFVYGFGNPAGPVAAKSRKLKQGRSRSRVMRLTGLFALDAFGGGFVVNTILILWLVQRFGMSAGEAGVLFFASNLGASFMQLAAGPISRRIGLTGAMLAGHLPASLLLIIAGLAWDPLLASVCLVLRGLLSQLDVPARTSLVMDEVDREERAAAISFTTLPFAFASAFPPIISGWLLSMSSFGWPLIIAGIVRLTYDALLYFSFGIRKTELNKENDI